MFNEAEAGTSNLGSNAFWEEVVPDTELAKLSIRQDGGRFPVTVHVKKMVEDEEFSEIALVVRDTTDQNYYE
jgi:hypothetical protein